MGIGKRIRYDKSVSFSKNFQNETATEN